MTVEELIHTLEFNLADDDDGNYIVKIWDPDLGDYAPVTGLVLSPNDKTIRLCSDDIS